MRHASSLRLRNYEDGVAQFWHERVTSGLNVSLDGRFMKPIRACDTW